MKRQTVMEYLHEKLGEQACKQIIRENNSLDKKRNVYSSVESQKDRGQF